MRQDDKPKPTPVRLADIMAKPLKPWREPIKASRGADTPKPPPVGNRPYDRT